MVLGWGLREGSGAVASPSFPLLCITPVGAGACAVASSHPPVQFGAGALEQNETCLIPASSRGAAQPSSPPPPGGTDSPTLGTGTLRGGMRGLLLCGGWLLAASYVLGGCRHRCCPGRNNACWAPGAHRARCYCDSYCERTGDCCQDYQASCRRAGECRDGESGSGSAPWQQARGAGLRCSSG